MRHSSFFSSLKQVEKRLKLENPPPQAPDSNNTSTESLSSPIYLHFDQPSNNNNNNNNTTVQESSEPPLAFLSCSLQQNPPQITQNLEEANDDIDDIQHLIQLLGLSDCYEQGNQEQEQEEKERGGGGGGGGGCGGRCGNKCECEGGFYEKIVGVKGPKCEKEVEKMEGWIKYFMGSDGGGERREPLRLAFLLLGKAAFVSGGGDCGFGGIEFPSTIQEFFKISPPKD